MRRESRRNERLKERNTSEGKRKRIQGKRVSSRCLLFWLDSSIGTQFFQHLIVFLCLFYSFFRKASFTYVRFQRFSLPSPTPDPLGRYSASRPEALEAIPRHRGESFGIPLAGHFILAPPCGREPFYLYLSYSLSLFLSLCLCLSFFFFLLLFLSHTLGSQSFARRPSLLSHTVCLLSLLFSLDSTSTPKSLLPSGLEARSCEADGRRCWCACMVSDGGHVAEHGGGAKGTWELYHATWSLPDQPQTEQNFNRFMSEPEELPVVSDTFVHDSQEWFITLFQEFSAQIARTRTDKKRIFFK